VRCDLVLEGGGVRGIGLVGAIEVLGEHGFEVQRVAGSSAGAVVGALVAAGLPVARMVEVMRQVDYRRFADESGLDHLGTIGKALHLAVKEGIYKGRYLEEWLTGLLEPLGVRTFADLRYDDPGASPAPGFASKLVTTASDVTRARLLLLPWDYARFALAATDQSVVTAVRASSSIPFFFEPVRLRDDSGTGEASTLVDGGLLSNYPISVFDRTDGRPPRWPTIGVKLSARETPQQVETDVDNTFDLAKAMLSTLVNFYDRLHLDDPAVVARTIFVDTGGVSAVDFGIDDPTREVLYQTGRAAAEKFLSTWSWAPPTGAG
jgi:NTE family protein